eukprot:TRINITY_DN1170_c0_g1_i2.p1 TRINITY_DN1170_c0_g1~~TRINITY_DN1170_c0_g1_i2.p1  ORF type:complete len:529 (+),score=63.96 TRINITY_DN1170_c0_g1_i2:265-1851(+)
MAEGGLATTNSAGAGDNVAAVPDPSHIVIVGAGPAGLLLAHYLLEHGAGRFKVTIFDAREDPLDESKRPRSERRYLLSLSLRGRKALGGVAGLTPAVESSSLLGKARHVYVGMGEPKVIPFSEPYPMYLDRVRLCAILLTPLLQRHQSSGLLTVRFNMRFTDVDMKRHVVTVQPTSTSAEVELESLSISGGSRPAVPDERRMAPAGPPPPEAEEIEYDLLVGADGVNSRVRSALAQLPGGLDVLCKDAFWQGRILHASLPHLPSDSFIQAPNVPRAGGRLAVFILQDMDVHNIVVRWPSHEPPTALLALEKDEDVKAWFDERLPWLRIPLDACQQFRQRRLQRLRKVKCGQYHHSDGRIALIGDAVHCTPPFVGQGCNAALTDAVVLARLLLAQNVDPADRYGENAPLISKTPSQVSQSTFLAALPQVLETYSALQVAEGHALVDLSCAHLPHDRELANADFFRNGLRAVLSPLLGQNTAPYADAYEKYRDEVEKVLASNERVEKLWRAEKAKAVLEASTAPQTPKDS